MITQVRLTNWRAYGSVQIELEPGTTFLIGMNGVGKSSMMEAVRWAFDPTARADPEFVRKGTRDASVEVELTVDGSAMWLKRSVSLGTGKAPLKTPRTVTEVKRDGRDIELPTFFDYLHRAWEADIGFVTRTAFLDMELAGRAAGSELRAHLCRAYGLDAVEEHVSAFDAARKQAEVDANAERKAAADVELRIAEVTGERTALQAQLVEIDERAADLDAELAAATAARAQAVADQAAWETHSEWQRRRQQIADAAASVIGEVPAGVDLRPLLHAGLDAATRQLDQVREAHIRLKEQLAAIERALAALDTAEGECPVCRRPLDADSRAHAHVAQAADQNRIGLELDGIDLDLPSTVVDGLRALTESADRLGDAPPLVPESTDAVTASESAVERATAAREQLLETRGALTAQIAVRTQTLAELEEGRGAAARAKAAYRRLGVIAAARDALQHTVTEVLHAQLGPIAREVGIRWDAVFPDRPGLRVDPDGNIARHLGDHELTFASFSAGEKTVARLLVKLATLITTTRVPFCWIDEPLEHLDEKSRLVVARTLAQFGKARLLDQIFVTTYQQSLVTMVGHSSDQPHIEYLGTSQVVSTTSG